MKLYISKVDLTNYITYFNVVLNLSNTSRIFSSIIFWLHSIELYRKKLHWPKLFFHPFFLLYVTETIRVKESSKSYVKVNSFISDQA